MSSLRPQILLLTDKYAPHTGGTAVILPVPVVNVCWHPLICVFTCWFAGWQEFDASQAYSIRRVPYIDIPKVRMPLVWMLIRREAFKASRHSPPDVIHAGQILETGLTALKLKERFGIPYVVHTYGEEINAYSHNRITREWMSRVLQNASAVTSISRYTIRRMAEIGLWDGPVSLLPPGIDVSRFTGIGREEIRVRYKLGDDPVLLTVARLLTRKGHDRVLEALITIRKEIPNLRYLIVGTGKEEARLKAITSQYGLDEVVTFTGAIPHDEVPAYFAAADVFVHPNRELENGDVEGFGMVFLEANASGLPVIGGNSGGTPDAIQDGVTGYLVDPNSVGVRSRIASSNFC